MKALLLLASVIACISTTAQVIYPYRVCTNPKALKEFSGLARVDENVLAAINDGGQGPSVFFMDTTGKLLRTRTFKNITNTDWEELVYHDNRLYIADVGDNLCQRKELTVYEYDLKNDTIAGKTVFGFAEKNKGVLTARDKHYDCEAGFMWDGHLYFFTKTRAEPYTGKSIQYRIDPDQNYREYTGTDSAFFGNKGFIHNSLTGAAISPSGNIVAFISCTRLWIRYRPKHGDYLSTGWFMEFLFEGFTQKEAVTFMNEKHIAVADERVVGLFGGRLYFYDIGAYLTGSKRYASAMVKNAVMKRKKKQTYDFRFESLDPVGEITLVCVDKQGNIIHLQKISLSQNKISSEIVLPDGAKPAAFWLVDKSRIILTSKLY